ncbi:MAG: hypothetical protein AB7J13_06295 [Pyrinomonadaceae bacterium]
MATEVSTDPRRFNPFSRFRAFLRRAFGIKAYFELGKIRPPLLICFDHLYSEFLTFRHIVKEFPNPESVEFIEKLPELRDDGTLSWSDLYHFQLILADVLPAEQLRTKIRRLRFDYRSVAGEKEFDDYMASKPPDLQSPPLPAEDQSQAHYEKLLRDDLKDLLGRMYLEYAILPVREERLTDLTWVAARLCLFSLICLLGILGILFFVPLIEGLISGSGTLTQRFQALSESGRLSSLTVFVVVISGAMGGFVSALQRIQTQPTEGDSLYNLSLLFHGSYSVFVAPITGGIFAIVLYLLFTSGTLSGTFFPSMYSPPGRFTDAKADVTQQPTPTATPKASPRATNTPVPNTPPNVTTTGSPGTLPTGLPTASSTPIPETNVEESSTSAGSMGEPDPSPSVSPTASPSPTPTPQPSPTPKPVPEYGIDVFGFLAQSGPARGQDYALLIVWCFIAGFAERFVPDALDRLVRGSSGPKRS